MTDFGVYGFAPDDSAVGYSYGSDASHNQATADAFSQALNEAKNDPRGQSDAQGTAQPETHGTTGGSNAPQAPVLAMASVSGAGGSTPPDKEWAARLAKDPSSLAGKSAEDIAAEFRAHGFPATVQQSTKGSGLAEMVRVEKGPINLVEVHPGGASHGGAYTKVSTSEGKYKYIDPDTYVRRSPEPGTKFFNARTGEQIPENSLPLRGQAAAKPADGANPSASDAKGGGEPPSSVRAPAGEAGGAEGGAAKGAAGGAEGGAAGGAEGAAGAMRAAGKVLVPLGIAASAWQIGQGFHEDGNRIGVHTGEAVSGVAGGWAGAWAGAEGGAAAGAAIGSIVPGVGTAVGGVVGGIVGGIAGGIGGNWVGEHAFDTVKSWF
jgi:hypothetical protein